MNRRTAIRRLATLFLTTASLAEAQQPKKVPRIGYLSGRDAANDSARAEAIRLALRERGYIEGQNIATEYRYAEGKIDRFPELVAELVRLKVDIIVVAGGDIPIRAAKNATKTIPIVMTGTGLDPVKAGLVESLARPGGNVTSLTTLNTARLRRNQNENATFTTKVTKSTKLRSLKISRVRNLRNVRDLRGEIVFFDSGT